MLVRHSLIMSQYNQMLLSRMTHLMLEALEIQNLVVNESQKENMELWHPTRRYEYPWALDRIDDLNQKVLDIGSNPQFVISLHSIGIKDLTIHHTSHDLHQVGAVFVGKFGWVPASSFFRKRRFKAVFGLPQELDIKDNAYDVITNLSVMEHVPPGEFERWLGGLWRMLKPGGRMIVTTDWPIDFAIGEMISTDNIFANHDWMPFIRETGAELIEGAEDCPWHPSFPWTAEKIRADKDVYLTQASADYPRLPDSRVLDIAVYGFILRKPR